MPQAVRGVLVESDESVMSFIENMNKGNGYILEHLDSRHIVIQESKVDDLKAKLEAKLRHTIPDDEDSNSEADAPPKKG